MTTPKSKATCRFNDCSKPQSKPRDRRALRLAVVHSLIVPQEMKRATIWTAALLLASACGVWFGFQWRNPPIEWDIRFSVTCGGGDYPKEAFRLVNDEVNSKIDSLIGENASQRLFVTVIPDVSGYRIQAAGESGSALFREPAKGQLTDWIYQRMEEIQLNEQRSSRGQPAILSRSKSEGGDNSQPEAEGRSR